MRQLEIENRTVRLYRFGEGEHLPLVIYHAFDGREAEDVVTALEASTCPSFVLAAVSGAVWERDFTPWEAHGIGHGIHGDGGAEEYLDLLTTKLLPAIEQEAGTDPDRRALAGYSYGGLFSVWAAMNTDAFAAICSASGSLWYPKLLDYAKKKKHPVNPAVKAAYFSLGDQESSVKNQILQRVGANTEELCSRFAAQGVKTIFEWNPGNHYVDAGKRTARGIVWCLEEM